MDILKNLFYGFPDLWGGGVAHSVMILALVITLGLSLGKLRVKGVSLGLAWILFIGLIFGHYSLNLDEHLLHFLKEFGLILFVYSIGLEVGPGFFASFKNGGTEHHHYPRHLLLLRNIHHFYGRYSLRCCYQHPRTRCSTAGFQRPPSHRCSFYRSRICHRLSYGCTGRHSFLYYIKVCTAY